MNRETVIVNSNHSFNSFKTFAISKGKIVARLDTNATLIILGRGNNLPIVVFKHLLTILNCKMTFPNEHATKATPIR